MWRGDRGGICTRTYCVAWWQRWDQNQDCLCDVVAVVVSKPGLILWRFGAVVSEPGSIVWLGGKITNRCICSTLMNDMVIFSWNNENNNQLNMCLFYCYYNNSIKIKRHFNELVNITCHYNEPVNIACHYKKTVNIKCHYNELVNIKCHYNEPANITCHNEPVNITCHFN